MYTIRKRSSGDNIIVGIASDDSEFLSIVEDSLEEDPQTTLLVTLTKDKDEEELDVRMESVDEGVMA